MKTTSQVLAIATSMAMAVLCGCRGCGSTSNAEGNTMSVSGADQSAAPRVPVGAMWRALIPSSSLDGDHTRAGRVGAPLRVPVTMQAFRTFDEPLHKPPQYVVISILGTEILVEEDFFRITGPPERARAMSGLAASFPDGWTEGGMDRGPIFRGGARGGPGPRFMASYGGASVIARFADYVMCVQHRAYFEGYAHDPPPKGLPAAVHIEILTFRQQDYSYVDEHVSFRQFEGADGGGAIGYDARVALFTHAGRFIVVSFVDSNQGKVEGDVTLPVQPKELSITSAGYALLSGGSGAGNYLQVLDEKGAIKWAAAVGFDAQQPAIDGGGGRLYLVGNGFAAFENGKALWSSTSTERVSAMAFSDGALAMTVGTELRVVDRDGKVRAMLSAPEEEVLGRPAIGPDGAIWVASKTTLYVAR